MTVMLRLLKGSNDKLVTSESPAEPATESPAEPATESPAEPATESPQDEHKPGIGSGENESAETQNVPSDYPTASYEHLGSHDDSHAAVAQSQATSHEAEPEGSNDKLVTSESPAEPATESPAEPATESPQDEHKPGIGSGENESAETQNVRAIPHHGPEQGSSSNAPNSMKNHVSTSYQASDRMPVVSTSFDSNIREHSSLAENDFIQNTGKSDVNDTFNMIHHSTTAPGNVISGDIISAEDDSLNPDKTNSTMNEVTTTADYDEDLDELRLTNLLDKVKAEMETKASHDHLREHVLHGSKAVSSENKVSHNPELLKLETHPTPEETGTDNDSTTHLDSRFRSNNKASPFIVPDVVQTTTEEEVIFDTDSSRRHVSNGLKIAGGVIGFILLAAVGTATYYKRKIPAKTQEEISFDVYDDSEIEHSERVETVVKLSDNVWA
ncbi:PT repeat family related, putative [Babesia ovis]|uniref:PT repeat family related, putative n=1 Tax=Babesia ovis TaxID=5869 RepID=A0A9W5TDN2_BABOV|nr:PT repeat family related, putative [Babesia ovis]